MKHLTSLQVSNKPNLASSHLHTYPRCAEDWSLIASPLHQRHRPPPLCLQVRRPQFRFPRQLVRVAQTTLKICSFTFY